MRVMLFLRVTNTGICSIFVEVTVVNIPRCGLRVKCTTGDARCGKDEHSWSYVGCKSMVNYNEANIISLLLFKENYIYLYL